ncbi:LD-carboxypeptidase [Croceicoccus hydrothermalis]|uniref:LD-carboxypeptidase n=1 Tax=Croceicoccus hydrothermalis TaxID=2867964 RepID=UPI001EFB2DF6|nr:LD-carboxypeptidase [Croceicoccus hydrothermalis]
MYNVAICAPSAPFSRDCADDVAAIARDYPDLALTFHPQCFEQSGHFAGTDAQRREALIECANDPAFDAVWFARGGYGACRIAGDAIARMDGNARDKRYFGYSDAGYLLAGLYRHGIGRPTHAPMPHDIGRVGGAAAVRRTLSFMSGDRGTMEPFAADAPTVAFNLATFAMICGTSLMPDLSGHVLMLEEVSEYLYAVDRLFFHISEAMPAMNLAGVRLGRVSDVPENDRPFGMEAEAICRHWCDRAGVPFLGHADIGHDAANRIVPFGPRRK